MSNPFGASENQERRRSDIARQTSQSLASSGRDFEPGGSCQKRRCGVDEPTSGSGAAIRRRTGPSSSEAGQRILASSLGESGVDEIPERAASCRPSPTTSYAQVGAGTYRRPASSGGSLSAGKTVSASGTTSNSQRLSSIEILNENRQRQLQLEQQESFKQHLEERQRFIQQQGREGAGDLAYSAYQVEPSAADYARMAAAANAARQKANGPAISAGSRKQTGSGSAAVNPFDEEPPYPVARGIAASDQNEPTTVSGRSGFLATLMGEAAEPTSGPAPADGSITTSASKQQIFDESGEELDSSSCDANGSRVHESTRYSKVAQSGSHTYDYDGSQRDRRPFYSKDLATLLAECRGSRQLVILIVAVALLLDNMLLTAVVPIIPAYLYKLRVYREHHGDLKAASANKSSTGGLGSLDANRDGRVDEDEIEAELERRVNESLANARDRFSGSFFHPRVLKPRDKFGNPIDDDDDDDDQSDQNDGANQEARRASRRGSDNEDDDDEDNNDQAGQRSTRRQNQRRNRYPRAEMSAGVPSRKSKFDMDDEYETNDDDGDKNNDDDDQGPDGRSRREDKMNGKIDKEKAATSMRSNKQANKSQSDADRVAPSNSIEDTRESNQKGGSTDSDDEEDDEDAVAARNWNKLKASLGVMAQSATNDSEFLASMCLSYVRSRLNEQDKSDGSLPPNDRPRSGATSRGRKSPDGTADDGDQQKSADDSNQSRRPGQDRARGGWSGRNRNEQTPRVDQLKPSRVAAPKSSRSPIGKPDASKGDTGVAKIGDDDVIINHQDIVDESFEVGVMFASKPIVQAIANPFVGAITNRVGFTLPMFLGFTIMFLSTLVFAFGETYATLFLARAIQGVGSACTSVAGMSMIADRFPDDAERGNAMAVALGGLALGVVLGPPFGGFMYEFFGKPSPFIVLAILALLDGLLQLLVLQPRVTKCQDEGASLMTLIKDPYILVAAGAITFANTGIGILEPALPLWMMDTMQAKNWEQGVAFLPAALSYLFSTNLFGNLGLRIGRWRSAMLGLVIIGCSLLLIPFASRVDHLILPNGAIGFAIGMVDSTMMPMLGYLVDIRHTSVYGSVYAIGDVAFCASFVFGPALSGTLVELIGFEGLIITTALICFAFAPLLILLRDPPPRQVNEAQMQEQSTLRYVNYSHLEAPDKQAKAASKNYPE